MRNLRILVGFLILSCLLAGGENAPPEEVPPSTAPYTAFQEELIAQVSAGSKLGKWIVYHSRVAWIEERDGKMTVHLNGKQVGGSYDEVKHPIFSRDGEHLLFFAKHNSKWVLVTDGTEHPPGYSQVTTISLQPEGTGVAFCACKKKHKCQLILDGKETGKVYKDISYPDYSADGKRLAYIAKRDKKWVAVVDGKELGPEFKHVWFPKWGFSRDGKHFFIAGSENDDWLYAVDGNPGPGFDVISPISFSRDGEHYAYGGTRAKSGFAKKKTIGTVVLDGKSGPTFEGRGLLGSWTLFGGSQQTIVSGMMDLVPDFHGVSTPAFAKNGALVYAARRSKGDVAVFVANLAGPGFDEILSPIIFSRDGEHFAYVGRQGDDFVEVRDNQPGPVTSLGDRKASGVAWIAISPDGRHVAYEIVAGGGRYKRRETRRALRAVVIDGKKGPEYDALGIWSVGFFKSFFRCVYVVYGAKGKRDLVNVDGVESRLYDDVYPVRLHEEGPSLSFVARDGRKFLHVTYELPKPVSPKVALLTIAAHP